MIQVLSGNEGVFIAISSRGCQRGVVVKAMDWEFEFQSRNYIHFRTNTLAKGPRNVMVIVERNGHVQILDETDGISNNFPSSYS